jgi:hypothetical protein
VSEADKVNAGLGIYGGFTDGHTNDGLDRFETYQEPTVKPGDDPLARFVMARIQEAEIEPRNEVLAVYDQAPAGPMAHRYAKHVRKNCVVFRQIVAAYLDSLLKAKDAEDSYGHDYWQDVGQGLRTAVLAIANRWSDHREFLPEWRPE